jgi:hypothetical protein
VPEPTGAHCAADGSLMLTGLDNGAGGGIARDGILQDGEVTAKAYLCTPLVMTFTSVADASTGATQSSTDLTVSPGSSDVLVRFDMTALPASAIVASATLTMVAYTGFAYGGDGNVYARLVTNDTWDETAVTSTNAPAATGANLGYWWIWYNGTLSDQTGSFTTAEFGAAVQAEADGDNLLSLRLNSPGYLTNYRPHEYTNAAQRPTLTVRYH